MKIPGMIFVGVLAWSQCQAMDEFGPLQSAQKENPAIFIPGNVLELAMGDVQCYTFNGEAEQCFEGPLAESDGELYEEASLDAKNKFYHHLIKNDTSLTVQMSGAKIAYQYTEGKIRRVVWFVPKAHVHILHRAMPPPVPVNPVPQVSAAIPMPPAVKYPSAVRSVPAIVPPVPDVASPLSAPLPEAPTMRAVVVGPADSSVLGTMDEVSQLRRRLAANDADYSAHMRLAAIFAHQGADGRAYRHYVRAVAVLPDSGAIDKDTEFDLLLNVARLAEKTGHEAEAIKYYCAIQRRNGLKHWNLSQGQLSVINLKLAKLRQRFDYVD